MRKLSARHRRLLIRRARLGNAPQSEARQAKAEAIKQQHAARQAARQRFNEWRLQLPEPVLKYGPRQRWVSLAPPAILSFWRNYEPSLSFILKLRELFAEGGKGTRVRGRHLDLAKIQEIDPAAGLVLAGELDRWRNTRLYSRDAGWHENVRAFLSESGLFELLGISQQAVAKRPAAGTTHRTLRYRRGTQPDGEQADQLRQELEQLSTDPLGPRVAVNNAICEAMTNAHHHAYKHAEQYWPSRPGANWWATGALNPVDGTMHMLIYDQGAGIPATLPRSPHWASAIPILNRLDGERTDAGLIEAALELRRTSTDIKGRGRGLYEMAEWIDQTGTGFLRILSGRGELTYRPGGEKLKKNLDVPFCGTLVEWEVNRGT